MRILVVEDDHELADILRRGLSEKLYLTVAVYDGESAKHLCLSEDFDLILLDLMIPGMDWVLIFRALSSAGKLTPVIALTACSRIHDRILALDARPREYVVKPFS